MLRIFAHRGLNRQAPENTLAAFRLAAAADVKWIETDVDILGDGTPVIMHDSTLDRTTNATGSLYDLSRADLARISAGAAFASHSKGNTAYANEPIPLLDELVTFLHKTGLNCNLEIKSNEAGKEMSLRLLDAVLNSIEAIPPQRLLISSFNPLLLYLLHERRPEYNLACLFTKETLGPDAISICELVGANSIHPQNRGLHERNVRKLKDGGLSVNVWTVNDPHRARELESWGVDGVFTDIADEMGSALRA